MAVDVKTETTPQHQIPDLPEIYIMQDSSSKDISSHTYIYGNFGKWFLPVPMTVDYNSDYSWSEENTSWGTSVAQHLINKDLDKALETAQNVGTKAAIRGIIQQVGGDNIQRGVLKQLNLAYNPNKQLYFNEVTMRDFSMIFSLSPTSKSEASYIKKSFIAMAKSAAPEYSENNFFFIYPDFFSVEVKTNGTTLLRRQNLAITSLNLDFSSDGALTWHDDGFPTALSLSIGFKESVIPTKRNLSNITLFGSPIQ